MNQSILQNIMVIVKYQCFGIKAACDSSFYNLITLNPIMALYDAFATVVLVFSTFLLIPAAALLNVIIISLLWVFDKKSFRTTIEYLENTYRQGAIKTKEEYHKYVDNLRQ